MITRTVRVDVDEDLRRVLIHLPADAAVFAADGWFMRLVYGVCGQDAIVDLQVGRRLGGAAFCAPEASEKWRAEVMP